jgi:hypothetical protein
MTKDICTFLRKNQLEKVTIFFLSLPFFLKRRRQKGEREGGGGDLMHT